MTYREEVRELNRNHIEGSWFCVLTDKIEPFMLTYFSVMTIHQVPPATRAVAPSTEISSASPSVEL